MTIDKLKSLNGLKNDTIKVGQTLKVSNTTQQPTNPVASEAKNWIIAKSEDVLFGADSKHSKGNKLPAKFSDRNGLIYYSKEKLISDFITLVEWTSMGQAEEFTMALVAKFTTNRTYSLDNTFTHPKLVEAVSNSLSFKHYIIELSTRIRNEIRASGGKIETNKTIIENYPNFVVVGLSSKVS